MAVIFLKMTVPSGFSLARTDIVPTAKEPQKRRGTRRYCGRDEGVKHRQSHISLSLSTLTAASGALIPSFSGARRCVRTFGILYLDDRVNRERRHLPDRDRWHGLGDDIVLHGFVGVFRNKHVRAERLVSSLDAFARLTASPITVYSMRDRSDLSLRCRGRC